MGAITTKYNYKKVLNLIKDTDKLISISIAPAIRSSLGEELGMNLGENMESILPSILRMIGFDYVFDVTFGADVTVMEEATELIDRLKNNGPLPMFTSCCPSWVKYAKIFHPELLPNLSTTKSPIGIQSTLIKTYFRELNGIEDEIISVVVAPCTAKKMEIINEDTDYVITTRELAYMIKECGIDIEGLKPSTFDSLLSKGSKSGLGFGRSGGVMSSVISTFYYLETGKTPKEEKFNLDIKEPITFSSFKIGDKIINVAVVYGMKSLEGILDKLSDLDFVEVMNCEGGCIGGGGQPLGTFKDKKIRIDYRKRVLDEDENSILYAYQNTEVDEMYKSFLDKPMSYKAKLLLHKKM